MSERRQESVFDADSRKKQCNLTCTPIKDMSNFGGYLGAMHRPQPRGKSSSSVPQNIGVGAVPRLQGEWEVRRLGPDVDEYCAEMVADRRERGVATDHLISR